MKRRVGTGSGWSGVLMAAGLVACGGGPAPEAGLGVPEAAAQEAEGWSVQMERDRGRVIPPPGYGTLEQDDITVLLESGDLRIKVVPLAEWVIRLTAPDTWRRLNGYKTARAPEILEAARRAGVDRWPQVFYATLFTRSVEAAYEPRDLQVRNQNFLQRPIAILPVTPGFDRGRLYQEDVQVALYLFSPEIDLDLPLVVSYQGMESRRWNAIRRRLDEEHSRVLSRVGAGQADAGSGG